MKFRVHTPADNLKIEAHAMKVSATDALLLVDSSDGLVAAFAPGRWLRVERLDQPAAEPAATTEA